jgi:hypothetical protein
MSRFTLALLSLATLTATSPVWAQAGTTESGSPSYLQAQPAPIERPGAPGSANPLYGNAAARQERPHARPSVATQPAPGVFLRVAPHADVQTVSASADRTELRVERGVANVSVHHPAKDSQILVDLPGGQTAVLKDGFYTFNAGTNTVRVLKGEAEAFPGNKPDSKPVKVKEDHAVAFTGPEARSTEFTPDQARNDVLPSSHRGAGVYGDGPVGYGNGFHGEPYGGWGYPGWGYGGWGDPYWGYGYPFGFGLGFGYYGGFGRGFGGWRR